MAENSKVILRTCPACLPDIWNFEKFDAGGQSKQRKTYQPRSRDLIDGSFIVSILGIPLIGFHVVAVKRRFSLAVPYPLGYSSAVLAILCLSMFFKDDSLQAQSGSAQTSVRQTRTVETDLAEVQTDTLNVYSDISTASGVVRSLKRGDRVNIRLQLTGPGGEWCKIAEAKQVNPLGYVPCSRLKRVTPQRSTGPKSAGGGVTVIHGDSSKPEASSSGAPSSSDPISFDRGSISIDKKDPNVDYSLDPSKERFYVRVPPGYSEQTRYGLVVFIDSNDEFTELPTDWAPVLDARHLLFIAPQNAGNRQDTTRRLGLGVLAALEMLKRYRVDPGRIYASGFSGGARMAGMLGFFQSDLFQGTIQNCGADFYQNVPKVHATSLTDTAGYPFLFSATEQEIRGAKRVRFALITGSEDFRRGNILDIFYGGFTQAGFQAKLFDVPGMSHDVARGATLNSVLDFLDSGR